MQKQRRRSIRLPGYDYTTPGAYVVTICTYLKEPLLGHVESGNVVLSAYGEVIANVWTRLPRHFPMIDLDQFVVMPNHIHGIIELIRGSNEPSTSNGRSPIAGTKPGSLAAIV